MEIEWFTFAAQIVNFLILVALLKRFLYGPILQMMDQREQRIAERMHDAERSRQEAEAEAEQLRQQQQQLEHQRETLLSQAGQEVEAWRREQLREAREEVQRARQEWHAAVSRQRQALLQELGRRASGQVVETARAVLLELADAELEQQVVAVFLKRLAHLRPEERKVIAGAMDAADHRLTITSGFELSEEQQNRIRSAIHRMLAERAARIQLTFHTADELICGIELRAGDHKIAWSIEWFLQSLDEEFNRALDGLIATEPEHDAASVHDSTSAPPDAGEGHEQTRAGAERTA